jgi:FkbM family methyltransferase
MALRPMVEATLDAVRLRRKAILTNFIRIHYAQFGEDIALRELFGRRRTGFYVDVGCYHPRKFSNTYALHRRGWHGINVDMEEEKIRLFKVARPHDCNVVAAVSDAPRTVRMYRNRAFGLQTTIDETLAVEQLGHLDGTSGCEVVDVTARTLEDIVARSPFATEPIDLLSIDAEGHDLQVLRSLDIGRRRPEVIVVEDHNRDIEAILEGELYNLLTSHGYRLHSWPVPSLIFHRPR